MNINELSHQRISKPLALAVGLFPLLSVFASFAILSAPTEPAPAAADSAQAGSASSPGAIALIFGLLMLSIVLAKITAIVGNFLSWYYAWVFHNLELNFVVFLGGLLIVISVFTQPLSVAGFAKIVALFVVVGTNLTLKSIWGRKDTRDKFHVAYYTHP